MLDRNSIYIISAFLFLLTSNSILVHALPHTHQTPLVNSDAYLEDAIIDHPFYLPRVKYDILEPDDGFKEVKLPQGMITKPVHISGKKDDRFNLMFFADGYTLEEMDKFENDVERLKDDNISPNGAMGHVADLLNVWATFIPSDQSGIGTHDEPLPGAPLGLYRPGSELRAVYVKYPKIARGACKWFRKGGAGLGGCDQAILLGNDPLYGGLGGEFTIITASRLNGPQVLRHELGHSLIPVGEEYDGGFVYSGVNSDKVKNLDRLKWKDYLSNPNDLRVEHAKMAVQAYPWHDLDEEPYRIKFQSSNNLHEEGQAYPTALLRTSLSSIPRPSHMNLTLNDHFLDLSSYFPNELDESLDRRWLDISLPNGLRGGENTIRVELSEEGKRAKAGQGGKMITSLEVIEYAGGGRFNHTLGSVGAYPTFSLKGEITLRPTNEGCLMRNLTHSRLCPICADALRRSLQEKIAQKRIHLGTS